MTLGTERIEAVDPAVARALRAMSGMERLRLGHETGRRVLHPVEAVSEAYGLSDGK